jgi:hypothetical protein
LSKTSEERVALCAGLTLRELYAFGDANGGAEAQQREKGYLHMRKKLSGPHINTNHTHCSMMKRGEVQTDFED